MDDLNGSPLFKRHGEKIGVEKRVGNHREREEELQIDESQRLFKKEEDEDDEKDPNEF
jgi:hypothetical protein